MVYLLIAFVTACSVLALIKVWNRPDPRHRFLYSLLPMLDLEHSAGVSVEWDEAPPKVPRTMESQHPGPAKVYRALGQLPHCR